VGVRVGAPELGKQYYLPMAQFVGTIWVCRTTAGEPEVWSQQRQMPVFRYTGRWADGGIRVWERKARNRTKATVRWSRGKERG